MISLTRKFYLFILGSYLPLSFQYLTKFLIGTKINKLSSSTLRSHQDDVEVPPLNQKPPLKVLLLVEPTPFTYISGYSNRFKEMLDYLSLAGDKVYIFTPDSGARDTPPKEYAGFPIVTVRGWELPLYKQVTLSFDSRFRLKSMIEEFKPDIIHCASPSAIIWTISLYAYFYKIPLHFVAYAKYYAKKLNYFDSMENLAKFLVKLLHKNADMTLCTSPQLRDSLLELGLPNVDVWRKGINTKIFAPSFRSSSMRHILSQGHPEDPLLIYIGRLGKEKRLDRLKKVLEKIPNVRLAFVGGGPAENDLKTLFKHDKVFFMGPLSGVPLSEAFASCDIFVMPSDSETLGFVVLEGFASGIPVVGVRAGGLIDIIDDEETGYIVDNSDDMIEFTAKTKELIDNPEKRLQMGINARQYAERWSWESATSYLRNVQYRKAIEIHQEKMKKLNSPSTIEEQNKAVENRGLLFRPDLA